MKDDEDFVQFILDQREKLGLPENNPATVSVENLSGNVNRVRRVSLAYDEGRILSFVVKHVPEGGSLERYPEIIFPVDRLRFEVIWNQACRERVSDGAVRPPELLYHDEEFETLVFEDLGRLPSVATVLRTADAPGLLLEMLARFLGTIHGNTTDLKSIDNPSAAHNRPFVLTFPLEQPELIKQLWRRRSNDVIPGEQENDLLAHQQWFIKTYGTQVLPTLRNMEKLFKNSYPQCLTHGDLHGESFLALPDGGVAVLDAELCDSGTPAFDVGTILAHVVAARMSSCETDLQSVAVLLEDFLNTYEITLLHSLVLGGKTLKALRADCLRYTGAELVRRSIGAAPFPGIPPIAYPNVRALLAFAATLICHGNVSIAIDRLVRVGYR